MVRKKRKSPTPVFILLLSALLLLMAFFGLNALSKKERYDYLISLTPTPTVAPRLVSVTRDPSAPTPSPAPTTLLFKNGSTGESVSLIQERLKALSYYQSTVDGQFGNGTKEAVMLFQKQHGLTADGIVGKDTYNALFSDSAQAFVPPPTPSPQELISNNKSLLVNKAHPVADDYKPSNLVLLKNVCPSSLVKIKGSQIEGVKESVDALIEMLEQAHKEGVTNWQVSAGYRSIGYQKKLFDNRVQSYVDKGNSKSFALSATKQQVAVPGTSEHHTGLAFDITVPNTPTFLGTKECTWLHKNCWDYGFVIRYQKDKEDITGFIAEAWHIRYVGKTHSQIMRDNNWCLEEYIEKGTF